MRWLWPRWRRLGWVGRAASLVIAGALIASPVGGFVAAAAVVVTAAGELVRLRRTVGSGAARTVTRPAESSVGDRRARRVELVELERELWEQVTDARRAWWKHGHVHLTRSSMSESDRRLYDRMTDVERRHQEVQSRLDTLEL